MSKGLSLHTGDGIIARDPNKGILHAYGDVLPTGAGYAPGCKFVKTNGNTIGTVEYINVGTKQVANFVSSGLGGAISVNFVYGDGTTIDGPFFVADRPYIVQSIVARPVVAGTDGGAVTAQIRKAPNGTAPASGTALHAGTIDLKGTVDLQQLITLSTNPAVVTVQIGNALVFDLSGVPTSARGVVSVLLLPA